MQLKQFAGPEGNSVMGQGYGDCLPLKIGKGLNLGACDEKINSIAHREPNGDGSNCSGYSVVD